MPTPIRGIPTTLFIHNKGLLKSLQKAQESANGRTEQSRADNTPKPIEAYPSARSTRAHLDDRNGNSIEGIDEGTYSNTADATRPLQYGERTQLGYRVVGAIVDLEG